MTAVPKHWATLKLLCGYLRLSRPESQEGKADVRKEETSVCTFAAAGIRVQASKERLAEITSGRSHFQQGLVATCKDYKEERKQS